MARFQVKNQEIHINGLEFGLHAASNFKNLSREMSRILAHEIGHSLGIVDNARLHFQKKHNPNFLDGVLDKDWVQRELARFKPEVAWRFGEHVMDVTDQAYRTGVCLNWYQRSILLKTRAFRIAYVSGFIPRWMWREEALRAFRETEAILIEMRYSNPKKLLKIDRAQKARFKKTLNSDSLQNEISEYYIPLFMLANGLISASTGKTDEEIERSVQAYQKFIKENPFPLS